MTEIETAVVFAKALVLPLGGAIALLAYRAYRRTDEASLRALALGFVVLTAGGVLGGGLDRLVGLGTEIALLANAVCTALGFALLAWSLYTEGDRAGTVLSVDR